MTPYPVAKLSELSPGSRRIVATPRFHVGVFNIDGRLVAIRDQCPHQGAPICRGTLGGTTLPSAPGEHAWGKEGSVLRCPWHGWEFDALSGEGLVEPSVRLKTYPVQVVDGMVVVFV